MAVLVQDLKKVPYFANFDESTLESLRKALFERRVDRGEIIVLEGDPATALFFVTSGAVKIFKTSPEGKEQILSIVRPGEAFNDISVFDGGPNPASAQAMSPVELYGISKGHIDDLLKKYPEMALGVMRAMAKRVRELLALVEDLSFKHVVGRIAKILLEYSVERSENRPRLTQQEMAAMAGTAREVVGRSLKSLEETGTIRVESRRVVVVNRKALQQLAMET